MLKLKPISCKNLIKGLKSFGFNGPYPGGKQERIPIVSPEINARQRRRRSYSSNDEIDTLRARNRW